MSDLKLLLLLIISGVIVSSKPIDDVFLSEDVNEVDIGKQGDYKRVRDVESDSKKIGEIPKPFLRLSNEEGTPTTGTESESIRGVDAGGERSSGSGNGTADNVSSTRQQGFAWFLSPFAQKVQFSPQTFIQDRIGQLKDTLSHIGSIFPNQQDDGGKQFANGGLVNLIGLNDSGFYTNRLDPVGFFGGNGWLANKGGILGGPGAFISTGSLFTDYPSPYKK